jgi:hypothetical protein
MPVAIHVDHRPFAAFWKAWWEAGLPRPVEYATDRLMLHLDMLPAQDAGEVRLMERDNSGAAVASDDQHPVQELDQ